MAVRPFWLEAYIDGKRSNPLAGGPRSKDGAMTVTVYQRESGSITHPVQVSCYPIHAWNGQEFLRTEVKVWRNGGYETIHKVDTLY